MLTFLHEARRAGFQIDSYEDEAVGEMTKNERGVPWISVVTLNPTIIYAGDKRPTHEQEAQLHHKAHDGCFISQSVKTEVKVNRLRLSLNVCSLDRSERKGVDVRRAELFRATMTLAALALALSGGLGRGLRGWRSSDVTDAWIGHWLDADDHDGVHDVVHGSQLQPGSFRRGTQFDLRRSLTFEQGELTDLAETSGYCNLLNYDIKGNTATVANPDPVPQVDTPGLLPPVRRGGHQPATAATPRSSSHPTQVGRSNCSPTRPRAARPAGAARRYRGRDIPITTARRTVVSHARTAATAAWIPSSV